MSIYVFPFLMDLVQFIVMLRVADAAGREMALSDLQTAWLVATFSLTALVCCLLVGWVLTRKNARPILVGSIILIGMVAPSMCLVGQLWPLVGLMALLGVGMSIFFNSFQTFMRGETPPGSLTTTIGRYTIAWSSGVAVGFLCGGVIRSWMSAGVLAELEVTLCLLILLMVLRHHPRDINHASADGLIEHGGEGTRWVDSRYVVIGWALVFLMNFIQRPLTTFVPKLFAESGQEAWGAGSLFFSLYIAQALSGFGSRKLRGWLYRRTPLVVAQLMVAALLAGLWISRSFFLSIALMILMGVVCGFLFFCSPYYVSNDAHSSRNVGINEALVGVGNVLGLLSCQWFMAICHDQLAFYPVSIVASLILIVAELMWVSKVVGPTLDHPVDPTPEFASLNGYSLALLES